jgi:hypothetical protein
MAISRRSIEEGYQEFDNGSNERYNLAYKRVKRIKSFYVHVLVYVFVNLFLIFSNFNRDSKGAEIFLQWETYSTALFWGIGLAAHGFSVFGRDLFFGSDWEESKIQEFMKKDKSEKWE